jgi:hypothetical protein
LAISPSEEEFMGNTSAHDVTRFGRNRAKSYLIQRFGFWLRKSYARDRHLHHRSGEKVRRCLDRKRTASAKREFQPLTSPFTETPDQMVRRVCRELGNKKNIIVINDEAHHCYRRKPDEEAEGQVKERLTGDERKEAERREEAARVWISGLEAVKAKIGVKMIYDLSATPFFLRGSGYAEGTLFPWVISDFSLIDAIESGIVKVPRVPVSDDWMKGTPRHLASHPRALAQERTRRRSDWRRAETARRTGRRAAQPLQQLPKILSVMGSQY